MHTRLGLYGSHGKGVDGGFWLAGSAGNQDDRLATGYGIRVGDGMDEGMVMRKLDGDDDGKRCQWN